MKSFLKNLLGYKFELCAETARIDSSNWKLRNVGNLIIKESPCKGVREIVGCDPDFELDPKLIGVQFFTKKAAEDYLPLPEVLELKRTKPAKETQKLGYLDGCVVKGFGKINVFWAKTHNAFWPSEHVGSLKTSMSFYAHQPAGADRNWLFYPVMLIKAIEK